jgi:phosphatidylglycerophosphate synthase
MSALSFDPIADAASVAALLLMLVEHRRHSQKKWFPIV